MTLKCTDSFKISVTSIQRLGEDEEVVSESAEGTFRAAHGCHYISYKTEDGSCMIKSGGNTVTVTRTGTIHSKMEYETGKHKEFLYNTPYGTVKMTLFTKYIKHSLNENGGTIHLDYVLDANGDKIYNKTTIKIERG